MTRKRKLTPEQKAAKKKRQQEYMYIFVHGQTKRVKRPDPLVEGIPSDEFIRRNADPIWLHHNEMWEYYEENGGYDIPCSDEDIPF